MLKAIPVLCINSNLLRMITHHENFRIDWNFHGLPATDKKDEESPKVDKISTIKAMVSQSKTGINKDRICTDDCCSCVLPLLNVSCVKSVLF